MDAFWGLEELIGSDLDENSASVSATDIDSHDMASGHYGNILVKYL